MKKAKLSDVVGIIGKIAPPGLAESWDNPGVQVGDPAAEITRIMVALDPLPAVIDMALASSCQLLLTHHPLIFKPQKSISTATPQGKAIHSAIRGGLAVACLHTNYDIATGGLNDVLAARLGIGDCRPLQPTVRQELVKLVVFVPVDHLSEVRSALFPWAEKLGNYAGCSFAAPGEGRFTPLPGSRPFVGSEGSEERVAEMRLEVLVDKGNLPRVVKLLLAAHPYEEPAFDLYPLLNEGGVQGLGRIGTLPQPLSLEEFAARAGTLLATQGVRYVGNPAAMVERVALCSGSGASVIQSARRAGADVLLTGDVKYHEALDAAERGIALVDAGHFSTEIIMVEDITARLQEQLSQAGYEGCRVVPCTAQSDPFHYVRS